MEQENHNIEADSRFGLLSVQTLKIAHVPGEHIFAEIGTYVPKDFEKELMLAQDDFISLKEKDKFLFKGILSEITISQGTEKDCLVFKACSATLRMDIEKKSRSFQDKELTYSMLMGQLMGEYGGDYSMDLRDRKRLCGFLIQYEETDWEFIKRVAARLGLAVIPDMLGERPHIYLGLPRWMEKEGKDLPSSRQNVGGRDNYLESRIQSREDYPMGTELLYQGQKLSVTGKWMTQEKGQLQSEYRLQKRESCGALPQNNIIGLGLRGTVLQTEKDKIRVQLELDGEQEKEKAKWFPIGTMYSGGAGPGIYVMPAIQETVLLCFKDGEGDSAYIRGGTGIGREGNQEAGDPDVKYLETPEKNRVKMSPEEVEFAAVSDRLYLSLGDRGIKIESNGKMKIKSKGDVTLKGRKITIKAQLEIYAEASGSSIVMNHLTHLRGKKIRQRGSV